MNRQDSLRAVTRRALMIHYVSPLICELAVPFSGSGTSITSTLDFQPVFRKPGTELTISAFSEGKLRLSWNSIPEAFVYVVYRANVAGGPFVSIASGIQGTFYVDTPENPGTYFYRVSGIEPDHGETELSNIVDGTV